MRTEATVATVAITEQWWRSTMTGYVKKWLYCNLLILLHVDGEKSPFTL